MNYITEKALDLRIKDLEDINEEQAGSSDAKVKKIIKSEVAKIVQAFKEQGMDEKKLYDYLEKIFGGKENFQNGKFKPIKETVKELLGVKNFKGDNFIGGWNEEKDTANINKLFNPLKKDVEDKLSTAKNEVDAKLGGVDAKLNEADNQIKTKLEAVDTKITEAGNEVKNKLKDLKPEVIKVILEELIDPKSQSSAELRNFLDKDNFYPLE